MAIAELLPAAPDSDSAPESLGWSTVFWYGLPAAPSTLGIGRSGCVLERQPRMDVMSNPYAEPATGIPP